MGDRVAALNCFRQAAEANLQKDNPQAPQLTYQLLQSAVINDPTFAEGWAAVGDANLGYQRLHGAVGCFRRALELPAGTRQGDLNDIQRAYANVGLSESLRRLGRIPEAEAAARAAIKAAPDTAYAYMNLSQILSETGDLEGSLAVAEKGFALNPNDDKLEMTLAFAELYKRKMADGLAHFEARFRYKLHSFLSYPMPKWQGEADVSVFLVSDQGIGDNLSFARFVPQACARARFVHMAVQPELLRLFSAAFQKIKNLDVIPLPCPWPPAQYWTTFVSLPSALKLADDEIINCPHIPVPPFVAPTTSWKSPDRHFHIGVAWAGSAANDIDIWRSFPMDKLLQFYDAGPGIQLYSLQVGEKAMQLHDSGCATLIRDLAPHIRDVSDTIGLLPHLDLVITCESALAHICALIGKECWIPYAYHGREFRIGYDGSDRIWCPNHRIFKQGADGRWEGVFDQITMELRRRLHAQKQEAAE